MGQFKIVKLKFIQTVLALLLVCNPVAVLAMAVEMTPESGHTTNMLCHEDLTNTKNTESTQLSTADSCTMDCCSGSSDCAAEGSCQDCYNLHSNSALILPASTAFHQPNKIYSVLGFPQHLDPALPPDLRPPLI